MARIVVVDDHEAFRRVARRLLESQGFEVVGEAADGESAIGLVATLRPDVVLLDVQLPGIDGFEVAGRLADAADPPPIILISSRARSDYRRELPSSTVLGFLRKEELSGAAIRSLMAAA